MKKTLIVFGLYHTLIEFDQYAYSVAPELVLLVKKDVMSLINILRDIKEKDENVDFHIITNLEPKFVDVFLNKTDSEDIFNQQLNLRREITEVTYGIYKSIFHDIFLYGSKNIFEIQGYDRIILVDSIKKQKFDFWNLKMKMFFNRRTLVMEKYKSILWGYVYAKPTYKIAKKIRKIMKKKKGVFVK